jgi:type IV secretion system protein VirB2
MTVPPPTSAIASSATWISDLVFGSLATTIAIIAIAWVGFAMLSGRINIKRGLSVIFGCFLLFGAKSIASGLQNAATSQGATVTASVPPPPTYARSTPTNPQGGYDPYAGAAVMRAPE